MAKTWAVVFDGPNKVVFRPVEVPQIGPQDVLVRTTWSWISNGTEGSFLRGERYNGETPASPEQPAPFPIVAGYQRVGTVVEAGAESGVAPGETVFVTVSRLLGLAADHGGHVLCGPAHRDQVRKLPADGPPPEAYAGLVLTQVGYNCGTCGAVAAGDAAVVVGDGMVGHWSAQTLRDRGARVMLLGRHPARLARFVAAEGDRVVNTHDQDDLAAVRDWAPGGVQVIVDTVGSVPTLERLFPTLARFGHLVSAGFHQQGGRIDIQLLRFREASLHAPSGWTGPRLDATLAAVHAGRLTTLPLVTDRLPANEAAEAWRRIVEARETTLGVLLDWRELSEVTE